MCCRLTMSLPSPVWISLMSCPISLSFLVFLSIISRVSSIYFILSIASLSTSAKAQSSQGQTNNVQLTSSVGLWNMTFSHETYQFFLKTEKPTPWKHCHFVSPGNPAAHLSLWWPERQMKESWSWRTENGIWRVSVGERTSSALWAKLRVVRDVTLASSMYFTMLL